jgi:hypothetical protein
LNIHPYCDAHSLRKKNKISGAKSMASLSDRLEAAALELSTADAIKDRLYMAWSRHLADLELRDFPREVRDEFEELARALNRERALPGDSTLRASLRKLSNTDAARFAALIVRTYGRVAALKSPQVALVSRAPAIPTPFLVETPQVARR